MIGYRLIHEVPFFTPRSICTTCKQPIEYYDLIPIISWVILKGRCRSCKSHISLLYPFIELITAVSILMLYAHFSGLLFFSYFIFFSLLIISIRTDFEIMLISRFVTVGALPLGFLAALCNFLPITITESILGAALGYGVLWLIAALFRLLTGKEGMGEGDMELLALIGSFTGPIGIWITLTFGALLGSTVGVIAIVLKKMTQSARIPFGPFLVAGAMLYVFFQEQILQVITQGLLNH